MREQTLDAIDFNLINVNATSVSTHVNYRHGYRQNIPQIQDKVLVFCIMIIQFHPNPLIY